MAIKWNLQSGFAVDVSLNSAVTIDAMADLFKWELTAGEMAQIDALRFGAAAQSPTYVRSLHVHSHQHARPAFTLLTPTPPLPKPKHKENVSLHSSFPPLMLAVLVALLPQYSSGCLGATAAETALAAEAEVTEETGPNPKPSFFRLG